MQEEDLKRLIHQIKAGKINSWHEVRGYYSAAGKKYDSDKLNHAYTSLLEILHITPKQFTAELFKHLLQEAVATKEWMYKNIYGSRAKDYSNPFRKMVYDSTEEMNEVIGRLEDNSFIQQQAAALDEMKKQVKALVKKMKL